MTKIAKLGYEIEWMPARHFIRLKFSGHWDRETAITFMTDFDDSCAAMAGAGAASGTYLILCDLRDQNILSRDVIGYLVESLSKLKTVAFRVAVVTETALQSMQFKRLAPDDAHEVFLNPVEAESWLFHPRAHA